MNYDVEQLLTNKEKTINHKGRKGRHRGHKELLAMCQYLCEPCVIFMNFVVRNIFHNESACSTRSGFGGQVLNIK